MTLTDFTWRLEVVLAVFLIIGLAVLGLVGLGYLFLKWFRYKDREKRSLEYVLLRVALPRENEIKIDAAEQLFASLFAIKKGGWQKHFVAQPHLSFEIVGKYEDIRFYVSCHKSIVDLVEKQIYSAYSGAEIERVDEYSIFTKGGQVAFAELKLNSDPYFPIKTYKDLPTDPLSSLTSALAKMGKKEGAVIQILVAPADKKWSKMGRSYISKTKERESSPEKAKYTVDPKSLEAVENKCGKAGFETVVRLVVSAENQETAKMHLSNIKSAFEQFSGPLNGFTSKKIWLKKFFMIDFIWRYMPVFGARSILTCDELATIFHFPNRSVETPHIHWIFAKRAPAPAKVPKEGLFLGTSTYRGIKRPVHITDDDRRRHIYVIGKTGVGKSELLKSLILQDIREGKGVCFIDPHDTVEKLLTLIPPDRAEDVIYFNPSDTERPMGLNLLEAYTEEQQHFVATSIIGLMYKLYDPYKTGIIGPRFEHAIRNAMLTVMCESGSTFVEVVRALTDARYVQDLLPKVKDPIVRRYWTDQIAQTADFHKSEVLDYIVSKFGRFVTNKMMRNIIGQSKSAFDFRKCMDEGKILLINLAKGKIGEENSNFLGLVLIPKILIAAMSRQDVPEEQRRDFYLYVDEFQNFATGDFAQILSEARKYRLNLCVANQFIGQMEEEVKNAVFGNVGTLITFRVGVADASFLQHEYAPDFSEADLLNIERFHVYMKTIVENEPIPPFSMDLTKDMDYEKKISNPRVAEMIKQLSRLKYAKNKAVVEAAVAQRARL
jgi:hypothetical protein